MAWFLRQGMGQPKDLLSNNVAQVTDSLEHSREHQESYVVIDVELGDMVGQPRPMCAEIFNTLNI